MVLTGNSAGIFNINSKCYSWFLADSKAYKRVVNSASASNTQAIPAELTERH
jgi:hypothetical protein